jgi:hypothetical protein
VYAILAIAALLLHLAFIGWVIFGALFTRGRRALTILHVASLLYAIFIEVALLPCPLTDLERWAQRKAGLESYTGDFIPRILDAIIYPNVPLVVLVPVAVAVCVFNLGIYVWRWRRSQSASRRAAD